MLNMRSCPTSTIRVEALKPTAPLIHEDRNKYQIRSETAGRHVGA